MLQTIDYFELLVITGATVAALVIVRVVLAHARRHAARRTARILQTLKESTD